MTEKEKKLVISEVERQKRQTPQFVKCVSCHKEFWSATALECPSCRNARAYAKRLESSNR